MQKEKNGWGTVEMLVLMFCLFIALLVSIHFISKFYGSIENVTNKSIYIDLEVKLEDAAQKYVSDNNIKIDGEYKISLESLKNAGYILDFKDKKGDNCNGYVIVLNDNDILKYNGYILCNDYQTVNY